MEATATLTNNNISVTSARTARKAGENSDLPANCRSFEDFAVALKKAVKQHYEKI